VKGGLTLRTILASSLLAVLIGGVFAALLEANLDQRDARRHARHSRAELTEAERLLKTVVDIETGARGFVIAGRERFLQPWNAARASFATGARRLVTLTAGDPAEAAPARSIARDGMAYIADYSFPLVRARRRGDPRADTVATTQTGKDRVDGLRRKFDRFITAGSADVVTEQGRVDSAAERALGVAGTGLGVSILLVAAFAGYVGRAVIRPVRRAAQVAGRLAAGDLAARMPESGSGEVRDLQHAFNTMGGTLEVSRDELRLLADEQAALRRVATLVAHSAPPSEVLGAVAVEADQLLGSDAGAGVLQYERDGQVTVVAVHDRLQRDLAVGTRLALDGDGPLTDLLETGRVSRLDTAGHDPELVPSLLREFGLRSVVAAPIVVEDRIWGAMTAGWKDREAPLGTEERMAEFTELAATAIANAESRAALTDSRARVVAAADETRRRIERDLHDGAQERLVHTIISLKLMRRELRADDGPMAARLDDALGNAERANAQLRELVRGILPSVLRRGGLRAGVEALASRCPMPVWIDVTPTRLPAALEATGYFIIAEALTNAAKHAAASRAEVKAFVDVSALHLEVRDDGVGGATIGGGSGLLGLQDRAAAVNGELRVSNAAGGGTVIAARLPLPPA
jgi:signal transduction histidine kinase